MKIYGKIFAITSSITGWFFNSLARDLLAEIFEDIQYQKDNNGCSPIYKIEPDQPEAKFFRARVADDPNKKRRIEKSPAIELGPPPARLRRPGRMNPAGISCFYGAFNLQTCVAELRPAVGSIVISAEFKLVRPITVLDTTKFSAPIASRSMFSEHYFKRLHQWIFMQRFMEEISKPISPNDEYLDYIPTQAVAEYLLYEHKFKRNNEPTGVEAIIYRSAQSPSGKNIALLGEAGNLRSPARVSGRADRQSDIFGDLFGAMLPDISKSVNHGIEILDHTVLSHRVASSSYEISSYEISSILDEDFDN